MLRLKGVPLGFVSENVRKEIPDIIMKGFIQGCILPIFNSQRVR